MKYFFSDLTEGFSLFSKLNNFKLKVFKNSKLARYWLIYEALPHCHYCYSKYFTWTWRLEGAKLKVSIVSTGELWWWFDVWWVWQDVGVGDGELWKYFWLIFSRWAVVTPVWDLTKCRDRECIGGTFNILTAIFQADISYLNTSASRRQDQNLIFHLASRQKNIYDLLSDFVIGNLLQYCPRITNLFTLFPASLPTKKLTGPFWK